MQNNLASLLKTAEELRIKGLAEVSWRDDESENAENNDNNNNVTETTTNNYRPLSPAPIPLNSNHISGGSKGFDNKENLVKTIPFLAPLSSPKDLSSLSRKKRGRPPLDESNHFTRA